MKSTRKMLICLMCLITLLFFSAVALAAGENAVPELTKLTLSNSGSDVLIKWDIPESADSFEIMRKAESEEKFTLLTQLGKKNSYRDSTALSGVSYTYEVIPYNGKIMGKSELKPTITAVHQPKLVSVKATTEGVEFKWKKVDGANKYTVYFKAEGDKKWTRITHVGDTDTYLHKKAPDGKTLSYTVIARNGSFNSSYGNGPTVKYLKTPSVTDICSVINGIKITWNKTDAAKSYTIFRRGAKETWYYLTSVSNKNSSYIDTSATPGKTYAYTVMAVRDGQNSLYTSGKPYRYIPVNDITAISTLCDGLTIKWKASPYATKYKLYRKAEGEKLKLITTIKSPKTLSYTDTKLEHGKSYTYILVTVSNSYQSTTDTIGRSYTFVDAPDAVSAVLSTKGYTVNWNKVSKATHYYIYRKAEGEAKWTKIARVGNKSSYNDATAKKGTLYYYCIRAGISGKFFSNYSDTVKTSRIDPNKKMVALTYDDGPHNTHTNTILDTLEKYDVRATFFVVGERIDSNSKPLIRAAKLGCEIGNHTYNHMNLPSHSATQIKNNLKMTDDLVKKYTGSPTTVMRPPGGATSSSSLKAVNKPVIMWSVDTLDWKHRTASRTVSHIKSNVYDGAIILMHDLYGPTASATQTIVPWLIKNGYQLVTVSELLEYRGIDAKNGVVYRQARP